MKILTGRMKAYVAMVMLALLCGCKSNPKYVEGQSLQIGIYIPTTEELVGLQVLNYLSGVSVCATSNMPFKVSREYSATNTYFGLVHINEHVRTEVETKLGD